MLSQGLQGEIAMHAGMKQICDCVWYLKDLSQIELVEVAIMFKADLYTPNEFIVRVDAVSVIVRGICSRAGRILTKHDCIGEDMLLTSTHLRDKDYPRTLSFVETMALSRANLADVCARFPDLSRRMRRNQIKLALSRAVVHINKNVKEKGTQLALLPSFDELLQKPVDQRFLHSDDLQPVICSMLHLLHQSLPPGAAATASTATPRTADEHSCTSQATDAHGQNIPAQSGGLENLRFQLEALAASQRRIETQLENLVSKLDGITALPAQQLQQEQQHLQQRQQCLPQQPSMQAHQQVPLGMPELPFSEDHAANATEGNLGGLQTHVEQAFARLEAVLSHTRMDLISARERSWSSDEAPFTTKPVDHFNGRLPAASLESRRPMVAPHRIATTTTTTTTTQASATDIIRRQADAFEASMVLQLRHLVDDCVVKATAAPRV